MRLMVLDIETTGVDPSEDRIIELGAALYDVAAQTTIWQYGAIIPTTRKNLAQDVNGISPRTIRSAAELYPDPEDDPIQPLFDLIERVRPYAFVAHTSEFERGFLAEYAPEFDPEDENHYGIPWVCSQTDIVFPSHTGCHKLAHLATDHDIPVGVRHRALADVLLLCELLAMAQNLEAQIERALKPKQKYAAIISFGDRHLAKQDGFAWDPDSRVWWKNYPTDEAVVCQATNERPFAVRPLWKGTPNGPQN